MNDKMIALNQLIQQAVVKADAIADELNAADTAQPPPEWAVPVRSKAEPAPEQVPTLAEGVFRPISPMLRERFAAFGR